MPAAIPLPSSFKKDVAVLVEDSRPAALALIALLKQFSFDIIEFNNGLDAWEWLKNLSADEARKIRVIFSDYSMPKMDGIELLRKVRSRREHSSTKFVFCSAIVDPKVIRETMALDCSGYMVKPITPSIMKKKLDEIFPGRSNQPKVPT